MRQIGISIVAALISMLDADFVFMTFPGPGNRSLTELRCNNPKLGPADLRRVRRGLQGKRATLGRGQEIVIAGVSGDSDLHVMTAPIGLGGDAMLAAGSIRGTFPTSTEKLLLNTGPVRRRSRSWRRNHLSLYPFLRSGPQAFFKQFPTRINRENNSRNREFSGDNREFRRNGRSTRVG